MDTIIAASLFQHKRCTLPGIGILKLVTTPADADFVNAQIKAPRPVITFSPVHQNGFNEFSGLSELMLKKINETGTYELEGVGVFIKDSAGKIQFKPEEAKEIFLQPVRAERVIRQREEHTMLVGDKETTNVVMTEYFTPADAVKKNYWWAFAIVIAVSAAALIAFNPYITSSSPLGNNHQYEIKTAGQQYIEVK